MIVKDINMKFLVVTPPSIYHYLNLPNEYWIDILWNLGTQDNMRRATWNDNT